ncbi:alpha/beta-hydrolase [Xylariaceae sp. AK1471]|nr:alpha/beta-hydrolase [Xylariaceae sp. AK1471]
MLESMFASSGPRTSLPYHQHQTIHGHSSDRLITMTSTFHFVVRSLALACSFMLTLASASQYNIRRPNGAEITYREPGICETTPGVKSYSGYVKLPSTLLHPHPQKLFFWFFESRSSPKDAPLVLWLQGGPGAPSMNQAISENGPCIVQSDSNSTVLNPWSWNNEANLLYIDQPTLTGFSYGEAVPGVVDMVTNTIFEEGMWHGSLNHTAQAGVFASQDPSKVVKTTAVAAETIWEFLQVWTQEFRQYRRDKIHLWSLSYGGHYMPAIAHFLQNPPAPARQSNLVSNFVGPWLQSVLGFAGNETEDEDFRISAESIGLVSSFVDPLVQFEHFPSFAVDNTYGIEAYDRADAEVAQRDWSKPGGCKEQLELCKALTPNGFRDQTGSNTEVGQVCGGAFMWCMQHLFSAYDADDGRDADDIARHKQSPFPEPFAYGYLTQPWVMKALGAEVRYTQSSNSLLGSFLFSGDTAVGGYIEELGTLLDNGVKVAFIYGDRDVSTNWFGGEAVSLAVDYSDASAFASAGYAEISTKSNHIGGMVRQRGAYSFSRIFQAGHQLSRYDRETAYRVFERTISGQDVATGKIPIIGVSEYTTEGLSSIRHIKNEPPEPVESRCYVLFAPLSKTCTQEQIKALLDGTAIVENYIVISPPGVVR